MALVVVAGLVVHLLLLTSSKDDSDPPVCHSLIGYEVPCGNVSYAAAACTACVVAAVLLRRPDVRPPGHADGRGESV